MQEQVEPTPFPNVNAALDDLRVQMQAVLGEHFVGMYLVGSLALGDFNPATSDVDFVVVADTDFSDSLVHALKMMHEQFAASPSPWATKVEAVYVPLAALRTDGPSLQWYPQMEKGMALEPAPLEEGWAFQTWTLRERGVVVAGPPPRTLVDSIEPERMRAGAAAIAGGWLEAAHHDPTWIDWLRERQNQQFVIQTLCRMLYSLDTGKVTSKAQATTWSQQKLGLSWSHFIQRSLAAAQRGVLSQEEVDETVTFIQYTVDRSQCGMR